METKGPGHYVRIDDENGLKMLCSFECSKDFAQWKKDVAHLDGTEHGTITEITKEEYDALERSERN